VACGGGSAPPPQADTPEPPSPDVTHADVDEAQDVVGEDAELPGAPSTVTARVVQEGEVFEMGRLSAALPGDIVLSNDLVRFVVRAQAEGHGMAGSTSGHLVDAVRVDGHGAVDGVRELTILVDFFQLDPDAIEIASDGADGEATVVVTGDLVPVPLVHEALPLPKPEVIVTHTYRLAEDEATLEITTHLVPEAGATSPSPMVGDLLMAGGDSRLWVPGLGAHDLPTSAGGRLVGLVSPRPGTGTPAYAIATDEDRQVIDASGIKAFMWESLDVPPEGRAYVRRLSVGGPDLASAMTPSGVGQRVHGVVQPTWPELVVHALDSDDQPVTRCGLVEGAFDCEVPLDAVSLRAVWMTHGEAASEPVAISDTATAIAPTPPATLHLTARDGDDVPVPFRLTGRRDGGPQRTWFDTDGSLDVTLSPGSWALWVHHGPFYDQHHETLVLTSGTDHTLDVVLAQVVDTTGWASCDLHVHGEGSTDSETPVDLRLIGAVADDVDYLVMTDHDFITDPAPSLAALGLGDHLVVAAGVEVSTVDLGHFNLWPMTISPEAAGQGAPAWFGHAAHALLAELSVDPAVVIQAN
ncbi:MAG: hypothetical protein QF464_14480, partial [Myxococcota bacterium]|nr:hypothetical protein [Myxococcota bacterium]